MTLPRRFHLDRQHDITGASGTGRVADGVLWPDGTVSIRWRGDRPSTVTWGSLADAEHVHCHGGHTRIVWGDPEPADYRHTVVTADGPVSVQGSGEMGLPAQAALDALLAAASEEADCPHCPDGHTPPTGGSQPWGAYVGPERDGDGQPTTIHVARSAGAHVAESDAA